MSNKKINELMNASSDEVATCFIAWLEQDVGVRGNHVDTNRKRLAMHLTAAYCGRFHTSQWTGSCCLFDSRGVETVGNVLNLLEQTDAFQATRRINGGNGYFQNAFNKYRAFWSFLADGGEVLASGLASASRLWIEVKDSVLEN